MFYISLKRMAIPVRPLARVALAVERNQFILLPHRIYISGFVLVMHNPSASRGALCM